MHLRTGCMSIMKIQNMNVTSIQKASLVSELLMLQTTGKLLKYWIGIGQISNTGFKIIPQIGVDLM